MKRIAKINAFDDPKREPIYIMMDEKTFELNYPTVTTPEKLQGQKKGQWQLQEVGQIGKHLNG